MHVITSAIMSVNIESCPYHGKRWRGYVQCLINKLRGNVLPADLVKRVPVVVCCCKDKGREVTCPLDKLPTLTEWFIDKAKSSSSLNKVYDDLKVLLDAASNEKLPIEERRALLNVVLMIEELSNGNVSRLKLPLKEQTGVDPVDTKVMELMLEGARPGVIFGKNGVHIKELCNTYNVTARFTKAGADRQKFFYDDPVLVVISTPVGHDQDIAKFEDALMKHVESVKEKEKKHREDAAVFASKRAERYRRRVAAYGNTPQKLSGSIYGSEKEAATARYEKKIAAKGDTKPKPASTLTNSRCLLCLAPYQPNETKAGACRYHSGFVAHTKSSLRWSCCKRKCAQQHPTHDMHTYSGCCHGRHMWRPTKPTNASRKTRKSSSNDIVDDDY